MSGARVNVSCAPAGQVTAMVVRPVPCSAAIVADPAPARLETIEFPDRVGEAGIGVATAEGDLAVDVLLGSVVIAVAA